VHAEGGNQAARRKPHDAQGPYEKEWGWTWPANRRVLYNRASADLEGRPWSERKKLVWWDAGRGEWTGNDIADFPMGGDGVLVITNLGSTVIERNTIEGMAGSAITGWSFMFPASYLVRGNTLVLKAAEDAPLGVLFLS